MKGIVKWFGLKGFGFITENENGDDYFVHYSNIIAMDGFKMLEAGQEVEFDLSNNEKGLSAINVQILGTPVSKPSFRAKMVLKQVEEE
jgi:CspA family cold shock protein